MRQQSCAGVAGGRQAPQRRARESASIRKWPWSSPDIRGLLLSAGRQKVGRRDSNRRSATLLRQKRATTECTQSPSWCARSSVRLSLCLSVCKHVLPVIFPIFLSLDGSHALALSPALSVAPRVLSALPRCENGAGLAQRPRASAAPPSLSRHRLPSREPTRPARQPAAREPPAHCRIGR